MVDERARELRIEAAERSGRLFDGLVRKALKGDPVSVVIGWVSSEVEDSEHAASEPRVSINGISAPGYVRRILEWASVDEEVIEATGKAFEERVGVMWERTLEYYEELAALSLVMDGLALMPEYRDKAKNRNGEYVGIHPDELDNEPWLTPTARAIACEELVVWADAVEELTIE